jgi:hypothetical protein
MLRNPCSSAGCADHEDGFRAAESYGEDILGVIE